MKQIILRRLTMVNFRGANQATDFGQVTTIKGWNGSGKSRHFDAFCWCLFGKDSQDRKDFEIKTMENGEPIRHTDAEVSLELLIDGKPVKLTRTLKEQWVKPRGQVEEVLTGNNTICSVDDVPMKVSEYAKYVSDILPDGLFKMITNPAYFCTMKWQSQREMLFNLAGTITDEEIAAGNDDYKALLDRLSGKSLQDYKKAIAAQKNRAKQALAEIQPKINGIMSVTPPGKDWKMIEAQIADLDREIAGYDENMKDALKGYNEEIERRAQLMVEKADLEAQMSAVIREAERQEDEKQYEAEKQKKAAEQALEIAKNDNSNKKWAMNSAQEDLRLAKADLEAKKEKRTKLLTEFEEVSGREFGSDCCPTCGQRYPEDKLKQMKVEFNAGIDKELDRIEAEGAEIAEAIKEAEAKADILEGALKASQEAVNKANDQLTAAEKKVASAQNYEKITIVKENLTAWVELNKKHEDIEKSLGDAPQRPDTSLLEEQKKISLEDRDQYVTTLNERETIKKNRKAIEDLEEKGRTLSAEIAGYEQEEYTAMQFSRDKIAKVEQKVNAMFRSVRFKLFDYTLDGNEVECCIPLVNGVHYGVANAAGKLFAGFEIIQVLIDYYGVCAPIFTDNAESLSILPDMPNQMIYLEVTRDQAMRGKYEIL